MRSLTIYIPGLFGPETPVQKDDLPTLPALNWFLSKADRETLTIKSPSYQLCDLFGLEYPADHDYPVAAIARLNDDNQPPSGFWLRADPVHVAADRDGLILLDSTRFRLSQHNALALAAEVNKMLEPRGMSLEVPMPYRWYIRLPENQHLITTPIDMVVGKDLLPYMPRGDDRIAWIQLLNEIQMVLHGAEINEQRQQEKQLPINSLWFWGTGAIPDRLERKWSQVISDDILARGLAMLAATPFKELPEMLPALTNIETGFNGLLAFQGLQRFNYYHDLEGWFEALMDIEKNWLQPLKNELLNNRLEQIHLRTDSVLFTLDNSSRFRFWRKQKNVLSYKGAQAG